MKFVFLIALSSMTWCADSSVPPLPVVDVSESGRFVLKQISSMRRDQYMIDTKTGRVWALVAFGPESNPEMRFQPVKYLTSDGALLMPEDTLVEQLIQYRSNKMAYPDMEKILTHLTGTLLGTSGGDTQPPAQKP